MVGAREINDDKLTTQQRNWINRHTVYTHGYGLVAAPANQVVCGGLPYFVSGFLGDDARQPGCSSPTEEIKVDQPRIYYGEQSTEYAIVGQTDPSKKVEFDRPQEDNNERRGTLHVRRQGRRADRLVLPPAGLLDQERGEQLPALRRGQRELAG